MLPAASSGAPLAILAKAKIAKRPKITHWIKRPDDRFMVKKANWPTLPAAARASRAGQRPRDSNPGSPAIHGVAGQERRHRTQPSIQSITSDNICHIKSVGVGSDWFSQLGVRSPEMSGGECR